MKKSKIIIPALGMLLLSTAASITGTVAWFTSVQTANADITSFAVRKVGGDLGLTIKTAADGAAYGHGTGRASAADDAAIVLTGDQPALCDASYDHVTAKKVYKANSNATVFTALADESAWDIEGEDESGNDMITYYAVSWTLEFTYTFGGDSGDVNLYFDVANALLTGTQRVAGEGANASKYTYKGFRIAFVNGSTKTLVWAGGRDNADVSDIKYQTGAGTANVANYVSPNADNAAGTLVTGDRNNIDLPAATIDQTADTSRADYIGTFSVASPTLSIKCIAWYEGNDPTVVNGARMDTTNATMAFYTRAAA